MAGGIDWFRWHHGSVTDPKFQLVAKRSKAALSSVIAVWAFVLEKASQSDQRGFIDFIDTESVDCLFGFEDGTTEAILAQFEERGLTSNGVVSSWEKRQPKRERDDDNSTARVRAFRERQATPDGVDKEHETPRNAEKRLEESREEKINTPPTPKGAVDNGFANFWNPYPRKTAKVQAQKAWAKLNPSAELQAQILAALAAQCRSDQWTKDGGSFVPHASTWLNQRRWEDQLPSGSTVATAAAPAWAGAL